MEKVARINGADATRAKGRIELLLRDAGNIPQGVQMLPPIHDEHAAYTLGYIANKCERAMNKFQRDRVTLQKDCSVLIEQKDQSGNVVKGPDGKPQMVQSLSPEKAEEFNKRMEELLDAKIVIERAPVKLADVVGPASPQRPPVSAAALSKLIDVITDE